MLRWLAFLFFFAALPALAEDGEQHFAELGQCKMESGQVIEACRIGYRTFGTLTADKSNAVLMPTWLYGTSGELKVHFGDGSSPQHLVDTKRFFGIAIDALGNGVSSSPSTSNQQHGTAFPAFTERDMVEADYRVMTEVLGLSHLHAVIGLSMGGEQTFVWAVEHPDFFDLAVPILGTPRLTAFDLQVKRVMIGTILSDPAYQDGTYTSQPPLKLANLFGNLMLTTAEFRNHVTPRDQADHVFARIEAPLPIDANDRLWQLRAVVALDEIGKRSIAEAAKAAKAKFLVVVSGRDQLVNPQPALDWAQASGAPVYVSDKACGHLIMLCDAAAVSAQVRPFLAGQNN